MTATGVLDIAARIFPQVRESGPDDPGDPPSPVVADETAAACERLFDLHQSSPHGSSYHPALGRRS